MIDLYERNARAWTEQRGQDLHERGWLDRLTEELAPSSSVLDVGSGSGQPIAAELLRRGFVVTGVDGSSTLVEIARSLLPTTEFLVRDMRTLDLGCRFDAVLAWHSLFHLSPDDQRATLPLLAAHVAPGGRLMFTTGGEEGVAMGSWQEEPLYHASLGGEEYQALLAANGIELIEHRIGDPACGGSSIWLGTRR